MSYILDALKQSERRRNRQATAVKPPVPTDVPPPPPRPLYRRRLFWLLLILLLALPLGYLLGRAGVGWLGLTPDPAPQAQAPVTPGPAPVVAEDAATAEALPARKPIVITDTPRILVEEPPTVSLNEPKPALPPTSGENAPAPIATEPAGPKPETAPPEPVFDPGVPDIRELPASIRSRLPALILSVHIYSPDPAARMANINGEMLREGQNVGALSIERITPKGVVLRFQGNDFHLGSVGG
ncbi:general secretion pathway protein GspB [Oceanimonas sp. CHS3-5]|uniref:general secretion pathway protein GspB n=1 Tax=Oceanimonas sp. CHS3-5 TaxID=3068186 RepID=UPI00273D219B|nr:general secretion pathway protein GspB [Oceanimonas sp. CHS3-5]MDP5293451.1 general secretion pathway protein GspB [Oceanimonas sp. CHS3-5]